MTKIDPPRRPPQSKNPGKWPFWRKPGFSSMIWTAKRGGVGVYPGTPQKGHFWPFLTIFGHFWPFLAIFDHFRPPEDDTPPESPKLAAKCEPENVSESGEFWRFLAKKGRETPPETPLARQTISNNRVIRPQIWNLRRKRGFFCTPPQNPPQVQEMWMFSPNVPVITKNIYINNKNIIKSYYNIFNYNKLIIF